MGYLRDATTGEIFGLVESRYDEHFGEYYFHAELILSPTRAPGEGICRSFYPSTGLQSDCATAEHRAIAWLMAELERG